MKIAIILAAGEGKRMKSKKPKVLHEVAGKTVLSYVVDLCTGAQMDKTIVIVGHGEDQVRARFEEEPVEFISQPVGEGKPYGTGYAVSIAADEFEDDDQVLILTGDTPLFTQETIDDFLEFVAEKKLEGCVLTAMVSHPFGYGRIIRGANSNVVAIVEERDATDKEKAITEVNTGIFAFTGRALHSTLNRLETENSQNELYLTDVVKLLVQEGHQIGAYTIGDEEEMLGINSRVQLAKTQAVMRRRINESFMEEGVTITHPEIAQVDYGAKIGRDTIIEGPVHIDGDTVIGEDVYIRGDSRISGSKIGDHVVIESSVIESSTVEEGASIGPFAHLRPNAHLGKNVHIGNFVEVKNSVVGENTKAGHLAYIGDGEVGRGVNIGCGVIFANYNGKEKFRTVVHDHAFIGSNVNLVAPMEVGEGSYIAAGSTITKAVDAGDLAVERSVQKNIPGWKKKQK
ncbi:MAG: bifunctional UDP-N-acetylglucosamine diphosphorylase/glucosamine-1-phosphate N-acetyltransferase GlmU [Tissierellia bacterium]|nr:bifunctional UDP-N-acetylglucosamine diphosphorylase/glucosamine-1-phosphate N-acetyltransferase GlmU [Tissierellia bacterium]